LTEPLKRLKERNPSHRISSFPQIPDRMIPASAGSGSYFKTFLHVFVTVRWQGHRSWFVQFYHAVPLGIRGLVAVLVNYQERSSYEKR
jgi:hypothetical protein